MTGTPILSGLIFAPFVAGLIVFGMGRSRSRGAFAVSMGVQAALLAAALWIWRAYPGDGSLQWVERAAWIPMLGAEYHLGVDGLGVTMALLTALVAPMAVWGAWRQGQRDGRYYALILLLQSTLFGAFTALNFFHWFIFWELSLVPAFFLIRLWGGPWRGTAAFQFFVYTMAGSIALLLAFLAIFLATGSLDFIELADLSGRGALAPLLETELAWTGISGTTAVWTVFVAALLGFAVKTPMFPFHTWLPLAYAEAPTTTTMLLTGLMSKMGVYGFLRILLPLFPEQLRAALTPLLILAVATIVLSASAAFAQRDLKRVFAYSSINHLGYCLLGVFAATRWVIGAEGDWATERAAALNGVVLQMFNHGLTAAALFCFIGFLEQRSEGRRGIDDFGGLRRTAPVFCGLMGISVFASLGLPGLNGFAGEFLIFKGAFALTTWAAALSAAGLLVTAIFLLTVMQRVFHGPLNAQWAGMRDLSWGDRWVVIPATVLTFALGIWPELLVGKVNGTVLNWVAKLGS